METRRKSMMGVKPEIVSRVTSATTASSRVSRVQHQMRVTRLKAKANDLFAFESVATVPTSPLGPLTRARRASALFGEPVLVPCAVKLTPIPEVEPGPGEAVGQRMVSKPPVSTSSPSPRDKTKSRKARVVTPPTGKSRAAKKYTKTPAANRKRVPPLRASRARQSARASKTATEQQSEGVRKCLRKKADDASRPNLFGKEKLDVNLEAQKPLVSHGKQKFDPAKLPNPPLTIRPKRELNLCEAMDGEGERVSPKKPRLNDTFLSEDPQLVTGHLGKMCTMM